MTKCLLLGLLGLSIVGCSDGGTPTDCTGNGPLTVTVVGLPPGVDAKITATGTAPHAVGESETLMLPGGSYTITADIVTVADPIVRTVYTASVSGATAAVCNGQSPVSTVTYTRVPTSNQLWVGSQNSDNDTFGYASAKLTDSGSPVATVSSLTAGSLPGAFDRAGDLWLIDTSSGAVGVKRYAAESLATSGEKLPDITVSGPALTGGSPGPSSLAFDAKGNLWVGIAYSNQVVEFAAATLSASSDSAATAVEISNVPAPAALAFDVKGNLWVGSGDNVLEFSVDRLGASTDAAPDVTIAAQTPEPVVGALANVRGLAFNPHGDLWVNYDGTLALLTSLSSGTVTPAIQIQADVLSLPEGIALDESGGLWMAYSQGKFCKFGASQLTHSGAVAPEVVISSDSLGSVTSPAFFPAPAGVGLYSSLK